MRLAARDARAQDTGSLDWLRRQAAAELIDHRGGSLLLRGELSVPRGDDLKPASELVLVVEIDGAVVGYLEAALVALDGGGTVCRVSSIYVEPEAREVGAGEALMDRAKAWAQANHAEGIDVYALPGSREVKNFFETSGFAGRLIVMHHRLEGA